MNKQVITVFEFEDLGITKARSCSSALRNCNVRVCAQSVKTLGQQLSRHNNSQAIIAGKFITELN